DRYRRCRDSSLARHDVSRRSPGPSQCAGPYLGKNAQAFHPHCSRRQSLGGAVSLRPDQSPHHFPGTVIPHTPGESRAAVAPSHGRLSEKFGANRRVPMAEEHKSAEQKTSGDAQTKLQSSKEHARKAAEDLKSAAGAFAEEYRGKAEHAWGEARGKAEQAWGDARQRVRTLQEDAEQYVRENPTKAI